MNTEVLYLIGIAILFVSFFALFYFNAEKFYEFQADLKTKDELSFKIFGSNNKYIDNKEKWIKHYKIFIVLIASLMVTIAIPLFLIAI